MDTETIETRWRTEAAAAGFGVGQVAACFGRAPAAELTSERTSALMDILGGPYGLTERQATFSRTDVIEVIASAVGSTATASRVEELADRFLASNRAQLVDRSPLVEALNSNVDPDGDSEPDPQRAPQRARVRRSSTQKLYTTPELAVLEDQLLAAALTPHRPAGTVPVEVVDMVISGGRSCRWSSR